MICKYYWRKYCWRWVTAVCTYLTEGSRELDFTPVLADLELRGLIQLGGEIKHSETNDIIALSLSTVRDQSSDTISGSDGNERVDLEVGEV